MAFWHHGIRFRYVTLRPRDHSHAGHLYADRHREPEDPAGLEIEMQLWAAGNIAYGRIFRLSTVPTDEQLLRRFARAAADPDDPFLSVDRSRFVKMGLKRDAALLAGDPESVAGTAAWLRVWRDTEQLIRHEVWPAVYAVAWEMVFSSRALMFRDVAEIAEAAMEANTAA